MAGKNRTYTVNEQEYMMIFAITGTQNSGKSRTLEALLHLLRKQTDSLGGIVSRRVLRNGQPFGYELLCVASRLCIPLAVPLTAASAFPVADRVRYGAFCFSGTALETGRRVLADDMAKKYLFIDEIGRWELEGGGWSEQLAALAERTDPAFLGIRRGIAPLLASRWHLDFARLHDLDDTDCSSVLHDITATLEKMPKTVN